MAKKTIDLIFPSAGVNRRLAYQSQPPFTSPEAINVRPITEDKARARGGSRPGLEKSHRLQLGGGNPVRMLTSVSFASGDNHDHWSDRFDEPTLGAAWTQASWAEDTINMRESLGGVFTGDSGNAAAVAPAIPDIDVTKEYWVEMYIVPVEGSFGGRYRLYARMDDTTPDIEDDGVMAELEMDDSTGDYTINLSFIDSASTARWTTTGSFAVRQAGWFAMHIVGNLVEVFWRGDEITAKVAHAPVGERVGMGFQATVVSGVCAATEFRVQYKRNNETHANARREVLVASANGLLYRETAFGAMEQVTITPLTLASDRPLSAVDRLNQLFIADNDGDGTRSCKVYDPSLNTLAELTALQGTAPLDCPLIALYRDRLVLAGAKSDPHLWYMSRLGDPYDWDYGAAVTDLSRAVAGTTAEAGKISTPLTALIPSSDDYMLFASQRELWILVGDPTYGGQFDNVSRTTGCVDQTAWCFGPDGRLVIFAHDGLYGVSGKEITSLSNMALPRELANKDASTHAVVLGYDDYHRGIHIFVTSYVDSTTTHFWFDWDTASFWMDRLNVNHEPFAVHAADAGGYDGTKLLRGCRDGYIRRASDWQESDDGTNFSSTVLYGPLMLGNGMDREGMLTSLTSALGEESGSVTWEIKTAYTAEKSIVATAMNSGTFTKSANNVFHPRSRGMAATIKLTGEAGRRWMIESMSATRKLAGMKRVIA
jgi:hypothetical protein